MSSYAERLRELRAAAGVTRIEVAKDATGIAAQPVCYALRLKSTEHGYESSLGVEDAVRITHALNCTDAEADELVARRMAEGHDCGDNWQAFTDAADAVIERYSDEEEET